MNYLDNFKNKNAVANYLITCREFKVKHLITFYIALPL